ncbi:MAG: GlxA family transcriptional regulator [Myxococcota bacterium]|nr:GlxA family transcriptional regulator [Myxococcota bacterium]
MRGPRRVALVALPEAMSLDVIGPLEVFYTASRLSRTAAGDPPSGYEVEVLAPEAGPLRTESGVSLVADRAWREVREPIDTLLVAGGGGPAWWRAARDPELLDWIRAQSPGSPRGVRRLGSVCSGALVLAEAGVLDGRRATTHWLATELLSAYPSIEVEPDAIFVRDGPIATSAGVTAGMDLALALVEEDHGRELALAVARMLVMFLKRPGGQSQFSEPLAAQACAIGPLENLPQWIVEHLSQDLSVPVLARQVGMSPRHFARTFVQQLGTTPARYVERVRVERARGELESTDLQIEEVAARCGFGSADHLRRSFLRHVETTPNDYRRRFGRLRASA